MKEGTLLDNTIAERGEQNIQPNTTDDDSVDVDDGEKLGDETVASQDTIVTNPTETKPVKRLTKTQKWFAGSLCFVVVSAVVGVLAFVLIDKDQEYNGKWIAIEEHTQEDVAYIADPNLDVNNVQQDRLKTLESKGDITQIELSEVLALITLNEGTLTEQKIKEIQEKHNKSDRHIRESLIQSRAIIADANSRYDALQGSNITQSEKIYKIHESIIRHDPTGAITSKILIMNGMEQNDVGEDAINNIAITAKSIDKYVAELDTRNDLNTKEKVHAIFKEINAGPNGYLGHPKNISSQEKRNTILAISNKLNINDDEKNQILRDILINEVDKNNDINPITKKAIMARENASLTNDKSHNDLDRPEHIATEVYKALMADGVPHDRALEESIGQAAYISRSAVIPFDQSSEAVIRAKLSLPVDASVTPDKKLRFISEAAIQAIEKSDTSEQDAHLKLESILAEQSKSLGMNADEADVERTRAHTTLTAVYNNLDDVETLAAAERSAVMMKSKESVSEPSQVTEMGNQVAKNLLDQALTASTDDEKAISFINVSDASDMGIRIANEANAFHHQLLKKEAHKIFVNASNSDVSDGNPKERALRFLLKNNIKKDDAIKYVNSLSDISLNKPTFNLNANNNDRLNALERRLNNMDMYMVEEIKQLSSAVTVLSQSIESQNKKLNNIQTYKENKLNNIQNSLQGLEAKYARSSENEARRSNAQKSKIDNLTNQVAMVVDRSCMAEIAAGIYTNKACQHLIKNKSMPPINKKINKLSVHDSKIDNEKIVNPPRNDKKDSKPIIKKSITRFASTPNTILHLDTSKSHNLCDRATSEYTFILITVDFSIIKSRTGGTLRVVEGNYIPRLGMLKKLNINKKPKYIEFDNAIVCNGRNA